MTSSLMVRAEAIAREAQRRRLEKIIGTLRDEGLSPEAGSDTIACRGKRLVQRWLNEPVLRFIGMGMS